MKISPIAVAFALVASPAFGDVQSREQAQCLAKLNKAVASISKAQAKHVAGCIKARARETLSSTEASECLASPGKVTKVREKAIATETKHCTAIPDFGFVGATPLADAATREYLAFVAAQFGGTFGDALIVESADKVGAKCQATLKKAWDKLFLAELKAFTKCKTLGLKDGSITSAAALATCVETVAADGKGKLAKQRTKIQTAIDKACEGVSLDAAFPGRCVGATDTAACLTANAECHVCRTITHADAISPDCDLFDDEIANLSCVDCNGNNALCDRRFDEVVYATSHNAMSNGAEGWLAPNQTDTVPDQLDAGVRSLMLDTWYFEGDPVLCHGGEVLPGINCDVTGMKPVADGLAELTAFLDANPNEVLSIIFESYISEADTAAAFTASGLIDYVHIQSPSDPWPTLRAMIEADTRLVVFTDDSGASLPWHLYVWDHAWETHFSASEPADFSCAPNRGSTSNSLFIFNHFLTSPLASPALASMVNFNPFFIDRALQCQSESGDLPNFVTVDFVDIGDLMAVVNQLNGLGN